MRALLLAAGGGTRMMPLTADRPKVLLPVAGRPLLYWSLAALKEIGVREATLVVNHGAEAIVKWARANAPIRIRIVKQPRRDGTGGAVKAARGKHPVKEPVLVLYGDVSVATRDLTTFASGEGSGIATFQVPDASAFGSVESRSGRLVRIHEKSARPPSRHVFAGVARIEEDVATEVKALRRSSRGEYELTDAFNAAVQSGAKVRVQRLSQWFEAGRPWNLLPAQSRIMQGFSGRGTRTGAIIEPGARLFGHIEVGNGTRIRSGAYIEGPVVIGDDCNVGPNCYIRPATSIGDRCHIGASVEIKNSLIMDDTNVPHLSYIGDSVIASRVNLGAGTNVANLKVTPQTVRVTWEDGSKIDTGMRKLGTIIGPDTKVGINCSLNPGTIVGANCVVGAGKVLSGWVPAGAQVF